MNANDPNNCRVEAADAADAADATSGSGVPAFVNVPCSRRGFFSDFDLDKLDDDRRQEQSDTADPAGSLSDHVDGRLESDSCDLAARLATRLPARLPASDWQPSYVNLEDTEIAPVLLASSRPAGDSHDFWKPQSVRRGAGGAAQRVSSQLDPGPLYDSPKADDHSLMDFAFRYDAVPVGAAAAAAAAAAAVERRSGSNSSGSDTQVRH